MDLHERGESFQNVLELLLLLAQLLPELLHFQLHHLHVHIMGLLQLLNHALVVVDKSVVVGILFWEVVVLQ